MTKEEAWTLLRRHAIEKPSFDMFPAAPYIEAYDQEPEDSPVRTQLADAMWTLLVDGDESEKAIAATFLSKGVTLSDDQTYVLANLYLEASGIERTIYGRLLSDKPIPTDLSQHLVALYLADPVRHSELTMRLVTSEPTEALWDAMVRLVRDSSDPAALRAAFDVAWARDREMELALLLRSKPEPVLRAAARLGVQQRFLEVCGLRPE